LRAYYPAVRRCPIPWRAVAAAPPISPQPAAPQYVTRPFGAPTPRTQMLVPRGGERPSFDCAKAGTAAARLICVDGELARLDGELGVALQKRKTQLSGPDQSKVVAEQLAWIKNRNTLCDLDGKDTFPLEVLATSKPCVMKAMRERIAFIGQTEAATSLKQVQSAPAQAVAPDPIPSMPEGTGATAGTAVTAQVPTPSSAPLNCTKPETTIDAAICIARDNQPDSPQPSVSPDPSRGSDAAVSQPSVVSSAQPSFSVPVP
jgi:uncharacterized protein